MYNELDLFPTEPFYEISERICSIKNNEIKIENLQIYFKFRYDIPGKIEGYILGNYDKAMELECLSNAFFKNQKDKLILESTSDNLSWSFYSNDFSITLICKKHSPSYIIGKIEFEWLEKYITFDSEKGLSPTIKFYIPFYNELWKYLIYSEEKANIFTSSELLENTYINIDGFSVRIIQETIYDTDINEYSNIKKFIYCIEYSFNEDSEFPWDEFIEKAYLSVSKFILLSSFLIGRKIDWFYSFESSAENCKYTYKNNNNYSPKKIYDSDLLIDSSDFIIFIETAIDKYNKTINNKIDLYTSIAYYLTSYNSSFIEQKFIILYIALENICNSLCNFMRIKNNMSENNFSKLRFAIEEIINEMNLTDDEKTNTKAKITELIRIPIKIKYEKIFCKYGINISDCYCENGNLRYLNVRNKLFHNYTSDHESILKEYYIIKKIYEQLILKLLGWNKTISENYILYNDYFKC